MTCQLNHFFLYMGHIHFRENNLVWYIINTDPDRDTGGPICRWRLGRWARPQVWHFFDFLHILHVLKNFSPFSPKTDSKPSKPTKYFWKKKLRENRKRGRFKLFKSANHRSRIYFERLRKRKLVNSCIKLRSRTQDPDPEFLLFSLFLAFLEPLQGLEERTSDVQLCTTAWTSSSWNFCGGWRDFINMTTEWTVNSAVVKK